MVSGQGRLSPPRQDIEVHIVAGSAGGEHFADRAFDSFEPIGENAGQHAHEVSVGFIASPELAPRAARALVAAPTLERCPVHQGSRLLGQHRQVNEYSVLSLIDTTLV